MAQFEIFRNPAPIAGIPFVVQVQSSRLENGAGRVVIPLVRRRAQVPNDHALTPYLTVGGEAVYANPFELATIPASRLTKSVGILPEHDQNLVMQAIDEMLSRA